MPRQTYSVPEVAEILGISTTTVYACIKRGEIPAVPLGRRLVVSQVALDRVLGVAQSDGDDRMRHRGETTA